MRHIFSTLAFLTAALLAYGTNNDFGAEEEKCDKDTFYYIGDNYKKANLFYNPSKIAVFDFSESNDEVARKEKVMGKFPGAPYTIWIKEDNSSIDINKATDKHDNPTEPSGKHIEFPCYTLDTGLELTTNGYIDVMLKKSEDVEILQSLAHIYKCDFLGNYDDSPLWYVLRITSETELSPIAIANLIHETGCFEWAAPDFIYFNPYEISYDPDISKQWGLYNAYDPYNDIDVSEAWGYSTGRGIRIAIIDNGIDINHEDLKDNISNLSFDAVSGTSPCTDYNTNGHGTHCAGIAAAIRNNNVGMCGVAPDAEIMNIRIPLGEKTITRKHIIDAINWAWENEADVISCSWECSEHSSIKNAIESALYKGRNGKGCIIIKSAGNKGQTGGAMTFPGNYNHDVISVGAIKSNGRIDEDSSYGEYMFVCAPGNNILSTMPDNKIGYGTGTSTAAPHVAGVAALILERNPSLTMKQVREIIGSNTNDISPESQTRKEFGMWDPKYGYGLVNALQCVKNTPRK